jgi:hypothetical protein
MCIVPLFDFHADFVTGHVDVKNYKLSEHLFTAVTLFILAYIYLVSVAQQPNSGLGCLIVRISRSNTHTHTPSTTPLHE